MPPPIVASAAHAIGYREERDADAPFLRDLYYSTRAEELSLSGWSVAAQRAFCDEQFELQHRHYRAHYRAEWLIIERSGSAIGRLYLARSAEDFRIVDIALAPEARGGGIGTAILHDIIAEASAAGARVSIHVEHANPARRLYARLGFVAVEDVGAYSRMERPADDQQNTA